MINESAYLKLCDEVINYQAKIIAVSKRQQTEKIEKLLSLGHRDFGENQAQAISGRFETFGSRANWHFIGHLQTNKVKSVVPVSHLIHSVDSMKVLKIIEKEAHKNNRIVDCLLQMHIAEEDTKFGLDESELYNIIDSQEFQDLTHVRICGMMGMATYTDDDIQVGREFRLLRKVFDQVGETYFRDREYFKELSMGMSGDYKIALKEGSTMIRMGTLIFGERQY